MLFSEPISGESGPLISPQMFDEFAKPELEATCERLPRAFYHLDGPGQLPHLDSLLEIENLNVSIATVDGPVELLSEVGFQLQQGETLGLVGESGCGKSMTALAIMDLLPPRGIRRADTLVFEGQDLMTADPSAMAGIRGGRMAMIFQEPMTSLDPCYTIGNQLEEAILEHQNIPAGQARERAVYLLEKVGITAIKSETIIYNKGQKCGSTLEYLKQARVVPSLLHNP